MSIDSGELKWSKSLGWSLEEYKDYLKNLNEFEQIRRRQIILKGTDGECNNCYHHEDFPHKTMALDPVTGIVTCLYCNS